ncbi:MAG: response regulator [Betaproteobacteria bacterium]|nr:response regulator [Betaproteobacteria bacterium]
MTVVYSLTEPGAAAAQAADGETEVPLEYRRLLRLINAGGHIDVLRGRLRRFTDQMIDDWLRELQDQKMIESAPAGKLEDFTFTGRKAPRLPQLLDEDSRRLAKTAVIAGATLLRSGSYIADDRVANLPFFDKPPTQTLILLVEDDPDQVALGQLRLKLAGYQVRTVERAKHLSRNLREDRRPDLVLLDVMLPDGNGFDLLAKLRASAEFATLPIVMLTAKTELSDIHNGLNLGADGYITKPYSKTQLAEVIARVLKQPSKPQ